MTTVRKWRPAQENPIDPVPGDWRDYNSFQKLINTGPDGNVDEEKLEEHFEEQSQIFNWEEIPIDFSLIKPGDRIRYVTQTQDNKIVFRTGGWVTHVADDYSYFAYMAHTKTSWCVQSEDCQRLWVIKCKPKKKQSIITFKPPPDKITKYTVYLPDHRTGSQIRVASFPNQYKLDRFLNSIKFQRALDGEDWMFKPD